MPTTALILANIRLRTTVSKCARSREIYKVIQIALSHSLSVLATTPAFWGPYCIVCRPCAYIIIRDGVVPGYGVTKSVGVCLMGPSKNGVVGCVARALAGWALVTCRSDLDSLRRAESNGIAPAMLQCVEVRKQAAWF